MDICIYFSAFKVTSLHCTFFAPLKLFLALTKVDKSHRLKPKWALFMKPNRIKTQLKPK